jgi:signal transduction histidine kinase
MDNRFDILGRLAAGVAHDLSNYLCVVDLSLSKLERCARDANIGYTVEGAREATRHALQLSACLLAYARGGSPPPEEVDLAELVRRVLELFRAVIPGQVAVVLRIDPAVQPIVGVAAELEQLVLNLVLNACDAMPRGGTLGVSVRMIDGAVGLQVIDTGCGLPAAVGRTGGAASPSTKAGRNGNGLGLGIVRGVADRHGATVQIAPRIGSGTSFTVAFPARRPR